MVPNYFGQAILFDAMAAQVDTFGAPKNISFLIISQHI